MRRLFGFNAAYRLFAVLSALFLVTACTDSSTPVPTITSFDITPAASTIDRGDTLQLQAAVTFSDGNVVTVTDDATWSSSDTSIVTVDDSTTKGLVQADATNTGAPTVTALYEGLAAQSVITVRSPVIESVTVTPADEVINVSENQQYQATANLSDGTTNDVTSSATWAVDNTDLAAISNQGLVTTNSEDFGSISVTASVTESGSTFSNSVSASIGACDEADPAIQSLDVTPASLNTAAGQFTAFTATATYCADNSVTLSRTNDVTWSSDDSAVFDIGENNGQGVATGVGSTQISATLGATTTAAAVTVSAAVVEFVQITPVSARTAETFYVEMTATAILTDGSKQDVTDSATWVSDDATIATVDDSANKGRVTGVSGGASTQTVVIRATYNDGSTDFEGRRAVEVANATLDSIDITSANSEPGADLPEGLSRQYGALGHFTIAGTGEMFDQDLDGQVTWASDCTNTLQIDATSGLAEGIAESAGECGFIPPSDTATISATAGGQTPTVDVQVVNAVLVSGTLEVRDDPTSVAKGQQANFMAFGDLSNGDTDFNFTDNVDWSVAGVDDQGNDIASIDANGLATGLNVGSATVTASYSGATSTGSTEPDATAVFAVGEKALVSIEIDGGDVSTPNGVDPQLTATATFTDNSTDAASVTWMSDDTGTVAIDATTGQTDTIQTGTVTITATATSNASITDTIQFEVTDEELVSVAVTPATNTLERGDTEALVATATYTDGSSMVQTDDAGWTSNDSATASVNNGANKGLVTAVEVSAEGTSVTITAQLTVDGITESGTASVVVTPPELLGIIVEPADASEDLSIAANESVQLRVTAEFKDGTQADVTADEDVTYESSNVAAATVSSAGLVEGVAEGVTRIDVRYTSANGSAERSVTVTVTP